MPRRGENIRKRKDGRWEARYPKGKNEKGKTIYGAVYASTYKQAKEKRRQYLENPPASSVGKKNMVFGDLLVLWMADNQLRLKASTRYRYQYLIDNHILPVLGSKSLDSITSTALNAFLSDKLEHGRLDGTGGLSPAYVRSITLVIHSALRYGMERGLCPVAGIKISKPPIPPRELSLLSPDQQAVLEKCLRKNMDETKLGILICLYTGLRIGEICALSWEDVDLKNKLICVRKTVSRVQSAAGAPSKTRLVLDTPKTTSSLRCIPICSALLPVLTSWVIREPGQYVVSGTSDFLNPRTYEYRFKKLLDTCQIPRINYHALRHTFATRCIEAGMDPKSLSEILGHANISITLNTYVHSSMELKRVQLEKITGLTEKSISGQ